MQQYHSCRHSSYSNAATAAVMAVVGAIEPARTTAAVAAAAATVTVPGSNNYSKTYSECHHYGQVVIVWIFL